MQVFPKVKELFRESFKTSWVLFKIMIPVSIVIKILKETGLIGIIGDVFSPFMQFIGLPGAMGLVWVTGMLTNLYGGIIAFIAISAQSPITIAQATILTTMMLVAHSLPVELMVAGKAGVKIHVMLVIRVLGAYILGFILNLMFSLTGTLHETSVIKWMPPVKTEETLPQWAISEIKNYIMVFFIIMALLLLMKILKKAGIIDWMTRMLSPVLSLIGIGKEVTPLTIIGMTLGISYGGAFIIREAEGGHISKRDVFYSMSLLGLCHSFIEDTLLMMSLGGHYSGILIARPIFAMLVVYAFVRIFTALPQEFFNKYIVRP